MKDKSSETGGYLPDYSFKNDQKIALEATFPNESIESLKGLEGLLEQALKSYWMTTRRNRRFTNTERAKECIKIKNSLHKIEGYLETLPATDELVLDQHFFTENNQDMTLLNCKNEEIYAYSRSGFSYVINGMIKAIDYHISCIPKDTFKGDACLITPLIELAKGFARLYNDQFKVSKSPDSKFYKLVNFFIINLLNHPKIKKDASNYIDIVIANLEKDDDPELDEIENRLSKTVDKINESESMGRGRKINFKKRNDFE